MYRKGFPVSDLQNAVSEAINELDSFDAYGELDFLTNAESSVLKRCASALLGICDGSASGEGNLAKIREYLNTVNSICPDLQEYQDNILLIEQYEAEMASADARWSILEQRQSSCEINSSDWLEYQGLIDSAERSYYRNNDAICQLKNRQQEIRNNIDKTLAL